MSNLIAMPAVFRQGRGSVTADNLNTFLQSALTSADLGALVGITGMIVLVQGPFGPGTGGCTFYYWDATATGGAGAIIPSGAALGAWLPLPLGAGGTLSGLSYRLVNATTPSPGIVANDHLGIVSCDASLGDVTIPFDPTVLVGEMVTFVRSDVTPNVHVVNLTDGTTIIRTLTLDQTSAVLKSTGTAIINIPAALTP